MKRIARHQLDRNSQSLELPVGFLQAQAATGNRSCFEQVDADVVHLIFRVRGRGEPNHAAGPQSLPDADLKQPMTAVAANRSIDRPIGLRLGEIGKVSVVQSAAG